MKKFLVLLFILILVPSVLADVDTKDGVAITTSSTIDGVTPVGAVDGQTVTAGGATNFANDANCVACWIFASGSELVDSSQNSNTLTNHNAVTFTTDGIPLATGQAAVFNGTDQYFSNTDLSDDFPGEAQNYTDMSVCFWINKDVANEASDPWFIMGLDIWKVGNTWIADDSDNVYWESNNGGTDQIEPDVDTSWTHYCLVFTGGDPDSTLTYAVSKDTFNDQNTWGTPLTVSGQTQITFDGGVFYIAGNGSTQFVDGQFFQIAVFNDALTQSECQSIFENGITGAD